MMGSDHVSPGDTRWARCDAYDLAGLRRDLEDGPEHFQHDAPIFLCHSGQRDRLPVAGRLRFEEKVNRE